MGVLAPTDWPARWVTAPESVKGEVNGTLLLRRDFAAKAGLKRATLNICGLGQYEVSFNGRAVTADVLTPGWTDFAKTCLYDTYDVTALLHEGPNAIGVLLGNGMYRVAKGGRYAKFERSFGPLQVMARIRLEYADGSVAFVGTDEQWRVGVSPMTFSSIYGGEDWDARLEQQGWDRAGFDAAKWLPVAFSPGPGGVLKGTSRSAPPVRTYGAHAPISRKEIQPGVFIYDLGQVAAHLTRFTVHGPAGSMVRVTPSELLNPDGAIFKNSYNGRAWNQYVLAGTGSETYTARFHYSGNRYLQVECLPAAGDTALPEVDAIDGVVLHSSVLRAGEFSCSNELLNRIYAMIRSAELSNMMSIISDCPHRERLGWMEQDHLHGPSFGYSYDMRPLLAKVMGDIADGQLASGLVPTHVPEYPIFPPKWRDAIEWGSAGVLIPWQQYQWTGDVEILRANYPVMQRYVAYVTDKAKAGLAARGLGDWCGRAPSLETPGDLVATAFYYEDVTSLAQAARLLGKPEDAAQADLLAAQIRAAFNTAFFHPETSQYGTGSQGANAMAVALALVAPENRLAVVANIVADLEKRGYALTVGEVCLPYLLRALGDAGRSDVLFAMTVQSEYPGYAYQLKQGATALCETWNAYPDNAQSQFMLGHIMEWFYRDVAGIRLDPASPGFGHVIIQPTIVGDLTAARASYDSVRGKIVSEWKRDGPRLTLHVIIPPNVTATVVMPTRAPGSVTESGKAISTAAGITRAEAGAAHAAFSIGSGDYTFGALLP
jgi:hypothetical protein